MNHGKQFSDRTELLFHQTKLLGCCSVNVWLDGSSVGLSEAYWSCSSDQAVYSLRTPHHPPRQRKCGNRWRWIIWEEARDGFRRWRDLIWSNTRFFSSSLLITCQMFLRWANFPTYQTHRPTHQPKDAVLSFFIHVSSCQSGQLVSLTNDQSPPGSSHLPLRASIILPSVAHLHAALMWCALFLSLFINYFLPSVCAIQTSLMSCCFTLFTLGWPETGNT